MSEASKLYHRLYAQTHKEARKAARKRWYEKHGDYAKHYYAKHKDKIKEGIRLRQYGLQPGDFEKMWEIQDGKCPICLRALDHIPKSPSVDHDHRTGKTRWLLCSNCNKALGLLQDDVPAILRAALLLLGKELERRLGDIDLAAVIKDLKDKK